MKKYSKLLVVFAALLVALLAISFFKQEENNKEISNAEMLEVKMINYSVDTDYNDVEYEIIYRDDFDNNQYIAEIVEKDTNAVVQSYSEVPEIPLDVAKKIADGSNLDEEMSTYNSTWNTTYTLWNIDNQRISAYVWTKVSINADPSSRQVNEVLDYGYRDNESKYYTLNTAGLFCNNMEFPCTTDLKFQINGMMQTSSDQSVGSNITYEHLDKLGFDMIGDATNTWAAGKSYNQEVTFKVQ